MEIQNKQYWEDAEQVDVNSPSYWEDATPTEAPANITFDTKNQMTVATPQTLNADETAFLISKTDKSKDFFAMEDVGLAESAGKGLANFILSTPQMFAGLAIEKAETVSEKGTLGVLKEFKPSDLFGVYGAYKTVSKAIDIAILKNAPDIIDKSSKLIERNKKYVAESGFERPKDNELAGVMYDIGNGVGSLAASLGLTYLTKSPSSAALFFGAMQKSQVYEEARSKGETPSKASDISSVAGIAEGSLEFIGIDKFLKVLKGNSAVKRFIKGSVVEGAQEGAQQATEELITQSTGIRDKSLQQTTEDILYSAFLGSVIGGTTNVAIGAFVKEEALNKGLDEQTATSLAAYAEKNIEASKENIAEFIDKELAPIAQEDEKAKEFITLMQKFGNDTSLIEREALDPNSREIFDQYIKIFNESVSDTTGVAQVEKTYYEQLVSAGINKDEAVAASKLMGGVADASARALNISPKEWFDVQKLEVNKVAEEAKVAKKEAQNTKEDILLNYLKTTPTLVFDAGKQTGSLFKNYTKVKPYILDYMQGIVDSVNDSIQGQRVFVDSVIGGSPDVVGFKGNSAQWFRDLGVSKKYVNKVMDKISKQKPLREKEMEVANTVYAEAIANLEQDSNYLASELSNLGLDPKVNTPQEIKDVLKEMQQPIDLDAANEEDSLFQNEQIKTDNEINQDYINKAVELTGITRNPKEAGYILPDGRMLDLSGRFQATGYEKVGGVYKATKEDYLKNQRSVDHREVAQEISDKDMTDGMLDFMTQANAVRVDFNTGYINATIKPSDRQITAIIKAAKDIGLESLNVEFSRMDNGETISQADVMKLSLANIKKVFDEKLQNEELFQNNKNAKGSITFKDDKTIINLFTNADQSTLLHEMGHLFLRNMRTVATQTTRPLNRKDYQTVKEWLGAKSDKFTIEQEEKFARGFEAYLREGKAPKPEMQSIFDKFREWLTSIYKSLVDLEVDINPAITKVFDRMLGADFSKTEKILSLDEAAKIKQDYETILEIPDSNTLKRDAREIGADLVEIGADTFVPISTRLGNISQQLKYAVRRYIFNTQLYSQQDKKLIQPFIEKVSDMSEADYKIFDYALKNRDTSKIEELTKKYKIEEDYKSIRALLDDLFNQAEDVGLDINYLEEYFPREVRSNRAKEYLAAVRGLEYYSEIEASLKAKDPEGVFSAEEKAQFINKYLRGFTSKAINLQKPSFFKERKIDYVEPQFRDYYNDSMATLIHYVDGVRTSIEARKLFGKSETDKTKSVGNYVGDLVAQGLITIKEEEEVKKILKAVVDARGTRGFTQWSKNSTYIYVMGSPISAITQIGDLAFSLYKNGLFRTLTSFGKAITKTSTLTKEDLALDNILQEFVDETRSGKAVKTVFKAVGLTFMDNVGKETFINSNYKFLKTLNKNNSKSFNSKLVDIFGDGAKQVKEDLANNVLSEDVKYLLFCELSDVQPISLAEMPVNYLRAGNGRIMYMLKTYTIKQLDNYRRDIYSKIITGEPEKVKEGLANLIKLSISLMLMGMAVDTLKDFILGRVIDLDNLVIDNLLKLAGATKWQIYKSREEGFLTAFFQSIIPPVGAPISDIQKDVSNIALGDKAINQSEVLGKTPILGKFYYWWYGGGRTKINKQKSNKPATP